MSAALAYLSLGSNLGNRHENLIRASAELAKAGVQVLRSSSVYETEPQDFTDQPAFLNCVLAVSSDLSPFPLLRLTQQVETAVGRTPSPVLKGPRVIDIDILLLGEFVIQDDRLTIPHPRMFHRRFVLEPLLEIAPDLQCPGTGALVRDLMEGVREQQVRRLSPLPIA
jgi:2-amino-4-hydroxy-6-hydroxymethyldihydropteridine diphosphokinase